MNDTPRKRDKVDRRLRAAKMRATRTHEFIEELGGPEAVGATVRTLVNRLTTLDLVIQRLEDRLAMGGAVDLQELTRLIDSQRHLVKAVRETMNVSNGGQAIATMTRAEMDAVRARLYLSRLAEETGEDCFDLIKAWHKARDQGIDLADFINQQRNATKLRDAIDAASTLLLPAPDDTSIN